MLRSKPHDDCPVCNGLGESETGDECDCWDVYLYPEKYGIKPPEPKNGPSKVFVLYADVDLRKK